MSEMEWKQFPARFDSKCQSCGKPHKQGDPVSGRKDHRDKWEIACLNCVPEGALLTPTDTADEAEAELNYKDLKEEFERGDGAVAEPVKPARVKKDSLEYFRQHATWGL